MEAAAPTVAYFLLALAVTFVSIFAGTIDKAVPTFDEEATRRNRQAIAKRKRLLSIFLFLFVFVWAPIPLAMLASTDTVVFEILREKPTVSVAWPTFSWQEWWHFLGLLLVYFAFFKLVKLLVAKR